MKWDLYKELRRSQTVDDERMQQKKTQNMDLLCRSILRHLSGVRTLVYPYQGALELDVVALVFDAVFGALV